MRFNFWHICNYFLFIFFKVDNNFFSLIYRFRQKNILITEMELNKLKAESIGCDGGEDAPVKRGSVQLWQFLLQLLGNKDAEMIIEWAKIAHAEFKLLDPEEVARRWGIQKNRPTMNYDKLSRSLRYYYEKGIMQKVAGERYVYRFINYAEIYTFSPSLAECCINKTSLANTRSVANSVKPTSKIAKKLQSAPCNKTAQYYNGQKLGKKMKAPHRYSPYSRNTDSYYSTQTSANEFSYQVSPYSSSSDSSRANVSSNSSGYGSMYSSHCQTVPIQESPKFAYDSSCYNNMTPSTSTTPNQNYFAGYPQQKCDYQTTYDNDYQLQTRLPVYDYNNFYSNTNYNSYVPSPQTYCRSTTKQVDSASTEANQYYSPSIQQNNCYLSSDYSSKTSPKQSHQQSFYPYDGSCFQFSAAMSTPKVAPCQSYANYGQKVASASPISPGLEFFSAPSSLSSTSSFSYNLDGDLAAAATSTSSPYYV